MQAISHPTGTFAPIRASNVQSHAAKAALRPASTQPLHPVPEKSSGVWEKQSFSFWDIIDALNPLQHIPIISTIYRKITGDEMGYASRIAGDTLYGGVLGSMVTSLVSAVANVFVHSSTGKDIGEHVMASVMPAKTTSHPPIQTHTQARVQAPIQSAPRPPLALQSASVSKQHTEILPRPDPSRVQSAIDQYKWQTMADETKNRSNHWA